MKKLLLLFAFLCVPFFISAQTTQQKSKASIDSIANSTNSISEMLKSRFEQNGRYKIYTTQNLFNFLRLDTSTGQIIQLQWSLKDKNEGAVGVVNAYDLTFGQGSKPGRFELYPTENIYTFIMLDTVTGSVWHVQWSMDDSNRGIKSIF